MVKAQGFFSGINTFFWAEDMKIGSASSDPRYVITAHPTSFAEEFLTPDLRAPIDRIRGIHDSAVLDIRGRRVHLQVGRILFNERQLRQFLEYREAIIEAAAAEGPKEKEEGEGAVFWNWGRRRKAIARSAVRR